MHVFCKVGVSGEDQIGPIIFIFTQNRPKKKKLLPSHLYYKQNNNKNKNS